MLNQRLAAARMMAGKLKSFEEALDDALVSGAELIASTPRARRQVNASPTVGHDIIAQAGEAMAALQVARAKVMDLHASAAQVRDEMGLTHRMTGDAWKLISDAQHLTVVAENDAQSA